MGNESTCQALLTFAGDRLKVGEIEKYV